jgi:hypothetical protein
MGQTKKGQTTYFENFLRDRLLVDGDQLYRGRIHTQSTEEA